MTVLMSGINMYSMALVMNIVLGWNISFSIWVSALTVGVYVTLGGLRSAIFNEVLQFVLIWAGALLIPILGLIEVGGWGPLKAQIIHNVGAQYMHLWRDLGSFRQSRGNSLDGSALRAGSGDFVWLLDDGFSGGAAAAGGEGPAGSEDGADYRSGVQNVRAVHRDSAGLAGAGRAADEVDRRSERGGRRTQLQRSAAADAGTIFRAGAAGAGNHGADCGIHVGDGGKRERVCDGVDVRHLPGVHEEERDATNTT